MKVQDRLYSALAFVPLFCFAVGATLGLPYIVDAQGPARPVVLYDNYDMLPVLPEVPEEDGALFILTDEDSQARLDRYDAALDRGEMQEMPETVFEPFNSPVSATVDVPVDSLDDEVIKEPQRVYGRTRDNNTEAKKSTKLYTIVDKTGREELEAAGAVLTPIGAHWVLGYDPYCRHCCGKWAANGITASGRTATPGLTVAMYSGIQFGAEIYIDGLGVFVVEDRGVTRGYIDVALNSHDECYAITGRRDAYIVERSADGAADLPDEADKLEGAE